MKILLVILLALAGFYVGYLVRRSYLKKEKFFSDILSFCNILITNIGFRKLRLEKIIELNKENFSFEFRAVLEEFDEALKSGREFNLNVSWLKASDCDVILNLFKNLGRTDIENQIALCEDSKTMISQSHLEAKENKKKYGDMYFKLFICFGVFLGVILI